MVCSFDLVSPARVRTNVFGLGTTFDYATAAAKKYGLPILIGIWVGKFSLVVSDFPLADAKKQLDGTIANSASRVSSSPTKKARFCDPRNSHSCLSHPD